jgi:hypothetical protein
MNDRDTRFTASSTARLRVMRDGHNIIRSAGIPKPVVLMDTRERSPFPLLANHPNWIAGERRVSLKTGDYTVEGMETLLCFERKSLADLGACTVPNRRRFLAACAPTSSVSSPQRIGRLRQDEFLAPASRLLLRDLSVISLAGNPPTPTGLDRLPRKAKQRELTQ